MKTNRNFNTTDITTNNLIGETSHRHFLELQATFGFAQRGGVKFPLGNTNHNKRLASDVNILNSQEHKQLIFSEVIFSN